MEQLSCPSPRADRGLGPSPLVLLGGLLVLLLARLVDDFLGFRNRSCADSPKEADLVDYQASPVALLEALLAAAHTARCCAAKAQATHWREAELLLSALLADVAPDAAGPETAAATSLAKASGGPTHRHLRCLEEKRLVESV